MGTVSSDCRLRLVNSSDTILSAIFSLAAH
jgi:hypothetical protein